MRACAGVRAPLKVYVQRRPKKAPMTREPPKMTKKETTAAPIVSWLTSVPVAEHTEHVEHTEGGGGEWSETA